MGAGTGDGRAGGHRRDGRRRDGHRGDGHPAEGRRPKHARAVAQDVDAGDEAAADAAIADPAARRTAEPHEVAELVADGLVVRYGAVTALEGVGVRVAPGTLLAVTGQSGAGKSTLLRTLAGVVRPAAGTVAYGAQAVTDRRTAALAGIGLMPQDGGLALSLTAAENLALPLLGVGVLASAVPEIVASALTAVGLPDVGGHLPDELSGGQRQRVALARLLAIPSTALLADEPTSELDQGNRELVLRLLLDRAAGGAVVAMATHDEEAAARADARLHLDEGRVVHLG